MFISLAKEAPSLSTSPSSPAPLAVRELPWFSSESLVPLAVAFNPLGDYALLLTSGLSLLVLSVAKLLPANRVFGQQVDILLYLQPVIQDKSKSVVICEWQIC